MSKLTRITQKLFGSTAGTDQISQFGSLFAGSPAFTTDPATMMALSNWQSGWLGAAIGGNAPAIEDMNAFCTVATYQLGYLLQAGVQEWDSGTTYYVGSVANDGTGIIYTSLTNNNTGNALTSATNWKRIAGPASSPTMTKYISGSGTYTIPSGVLYLRVQLVGGGGGGGGSGTATGGTGSTGATTSFGPAFLAGLGGVGGVSGGSGGGGGVASNPTLGVVIQGGGGGGGMTAGTGSGNVTISAGAGGNAAYFAGGAPAPSPSGANPGLPGATNSGGGGSGAIHNPGANILSGGGGGAGGFTEAIVSGATLVGLGATTSYSIGTGGAGGTAGTSGAIGGAGADGQILIYEYYQ